MRSRNALAIARIDEILSPQPITQPNLTMTNQSIRNFAPLIVRALICVCATGLGLVFLPLRLASQDIKFTDPIIFVRMLTPPGFSTPMSEDNLDHLPDLPTYAYMNLSQAIDENGTIRDMSGSSWSTNPEMSKTFPSENRKIQFLPAMRAGAPAPCRAYYTLIYNPASAPETGPDAAPRLLNVVPALVSSDVWRDISRDIKQKEVAWLNVSINANGVMTKCILAEDSAWAAPIQEDIYRAVALWEFAPARRDEKSVAAEIRLPVRVVPVRLPVRMAPSAIPPPAQAGKNGIKGKAGPRGGQGPGDGNTIEAISAPRLLSQRVVQPSPYVPANDNDKTLVQLPVYTVTGTRTLPPPESWYYAKLPGIEVLSNTSKAETRRFLDDFQQLQIALRIVWPALMDTKARTATLLVLCGRNGTYDTLKPVRLSPSAPADARGFYAEDSERTAITLDYTWYGNSARANNWFIDPYRTFYTNYARFLLRRSTEGTFLPEWFESGMSQLISTIDFTGKYVQFAKMDPQLFISSSRNPSRGNIYIMSLADMFSSDRRRRVRTPWNAQAYEFVHMCLYGMNEKYQKSFSQFLQIASNKRDVTEDDFKQCFGCSYADMELALRNYLGYTAYKSVLFTPKKGSPGMPKPVAVDIRDATQGEIGRIKGEVLRLGGSPVEARNALIEAYLRGERDPALLASLGLLEYQEKRESRAVRFLEAATGAGVVRPRAYLTLAQIRFNQETGGADELLKLNPTQADSILAPLSVALKQPPPMPGVYALIGDVWLDSQTSPTKDQMAVVLEGARQFPKDAGLIYNAASLYARHGDPETAANLIKLGAKATTTPAMREKFATLQATLPAPPAASAK